MFGGSGVAEDNRQPHIEGRSSRARVYRIQGNKSGSNWALLVMPSNLGLAIEKFVSGEPGSAERVVAADAPRCHRHAALLVEAAGIDDVVQESLVELLATAHRLEYPGAAEAWVRLIVRKTGSCGFNEGSFPDRRRANFASTSTQLARVPLKVALPKLPRDTSPEISSPATLPAKPRVMAIGWVTATFEASASSLIVPSEMSTFPSGPPSIEPLRTSPLVARTKVTSCAPIGVFMVTFHVPSAAIVSSWKLRAPTRVEFSTRLTQQLEGHLPANGSPHNALTQDGFCPSSSPQLELPRQPVSIPAERLSVGRWLMHDQPRAVAMVVLGLGTPVAVQDVQVSRGSEGHTAWSGPSRYPAHLE